MRKLEELKASDEVEIVAYDMAGNPIPAIVRRYANGAFSMERRNKPGYYVCLSSVQGWLPEQDAPRTEGKNGLAFYSDSESLLTNLINGMAVNSANLEHVAKTGKVNGFLKLEIERVCALYYSKMSAT